MTHRTGNMNVTALK